MVVTRPRRCSPSLLHDSVLISHFGSSSSGRSGEINATTATPSVFAAHHGEPEIMHDDPHHDRAGRHSSSVADDLRKYGAGHQ